MGAGDRAGPALTGVRVLVVEADPDVRELVAEILAGRGAEVITTATAVQALDLLRRERPDVLVSSISLPERNGYWLMSMIRALSPEHGGRIPAVAFTGGNYALACGDAIDSAFDAYLVKPKDLDRLAAVVESLSRAPRKSPRAPG